MRRRLLAPLLLAGALVPGLVAGCSSETRDKASDAASSAKDDVAGGIDAATARAQAEGLRAALKVNKTAKADGVRSVAAIGESAKDLPGSPEVTGVDDGDGDGLDDDGKVQVTVDGTSACLTLPATGTDTKVSSGSC